MIVIQKHSKVCTNFAEMSQKVLLADSEPFRFKERLKDKTNNDGTINGKKVVPLKYLNSL